MVSPSEVRSSNGSNGNGRHPVPILRQAQTVFIVVSLVSLVVAVVVSAIWHETIAHRMARHQAQTLAQQALERLNTHNVTATNVVLVYPDNSEDPWSSNETMVQSDSSTTATTKVVVTSPSRNWTYHSDVSIRPVVTCESTLILVRHCEDLGDPEGTDWNDTSKHCSELGYQHAAYLASQFAEDGADARRWPRPVRLYGLIRATNQRQYETLAPLAKQSGLNVTMLDFATEGTSELVREWFAELQQSSSSSSSSSICGRVAVAAWKHAYIPNLAHQLGCGPDQGCPVTAWNDYDFDSAWQLRYVRFASVDSENKKFAAKQPQQQPGSNGDSVWHVYGTITQQGFDPAAFRKHNL